MRLLIFLVFSRYRLACILCYQYIIRYRIVFSDTWRNNVESGKAIIETWFDLFFKQNIFLACLFLKLILY